MKKLKILFYFIKEYLTVMLIMTGIRGLFSFVNLEGVKNINFNLMLRSFLHGLVFDTSITSYYLIGFILCFILFRFFKSIYLGIFGKVFLKIYKVIMSTLIFGIMFADIRYFKQFNSHLTSTILDYASNPNEIILTVLADRLSIILFVIFILVEIIYLIISFKLFRTLEIDEKDLKNKYHFNFKDSLTKRIVDFILEIVLCLTVLIFCIFGARGGFSQGTLNWGRAYFSENYFANQTALNGVFTLFKSIDIDRKEKNKSAKDTNFIYSKEEIKNNIRGYIETSQDRFISDKNIVLRETDTKKEEKEYNVVIILMESFMGDTVGAIGGNPDITPEYNKLASKGLIFNNFYSNGNRSNRGMLSVLTGFPSQYGKSILKKSIAQKPFISLSSILKKRGYNTNFIYGGDIEFDNMKGFLTLNGIDNLVSRDDFPLKDRSIKWGVPDDKVLTFTDDYLSKLKEPFFCEIFTLSNHAPFDVPEEFKKYTEKEYKNYERYNAFAFADYSIGKFVNLVKDKKWAQNTVFVFVADHGEHRGEKVEVDWKKFTNPLLIWTPGGQIEPGTFEKLGSQVDLLPSLMNILGGKYINSSWGKNLFLKESKNDFVYIIEHGFIGLIDNDNVFVKNMETKKYLTRRKSDNKKIKISNELEEKYKKALNTYYELTIRQEKEGSFGNVK